MPRFSGDLLKERREHAGRQREWVAVKIDRSAQSVALYERGVRPPASVLRALAEVLDCTPEDFFLQPEFTS